MHLYNVFSNDINCLEFVKGNKLELDALYLTYLWQHDALKLGEFITRGQQTVTVSWIPYIKQGILMKYIYFLKKIISESKPYRICMRQTKIYIIWWWHSSLLDILMKGQLNLWLWCTTLRGNQFQVLQRCSTYCQECMTGYTK